MGIDFGKFGVALMLATSLMFIGGCSYYGTGDGGALTKTFFAEEVSRDDEARSKRIRSGYTDSSASREGERITEAREERRKDGKFFMILAVAGFILGGCAYVARGRE